MNDETSICRVSNSLTPLGVLQRWPADRPVMMLHSGRHDDRWARWSIMAAPRGVFRHDGRSHWTASASSRIDSVPLIDDALNDLDALLEATAVDRGRGDDVLPFVGGWIGYFSYDLGCAIELTAVSTAGADDDRNWPLIELAWCPDALVYDHAQAQWWSIGRGSELLAEVETEPGIAGELQIGPLHAAWTARDHRNAVQRTIDYIAAGDIFQANITGRTSCTMAGSPRCLGIRALAHAESWYGAYLEFDRRVVISLSPELFLEFDARSSMIRSKPMKGTLPIERDRRELVDSKKDAAELAMIVDLMRNDLGRVCEYGTIRVAHPRVIECHPTVWQSAAEVEGRVRDGVSFGHILAATFPPGSVTGAPKIRAMQIIDELEPVRRGPYCGAIGAISRCGSFQFNVAIRSMLLTHAPPGDTWRIDYPAGGGIVADSNPHAEYEEAMTKTEIFRRIIAQPDASATPAVTTVC